LRATTAGQAISVSLEHHVDVMIVDAELPGEAGLAVIAHLAGQPLAQHGRTPAIVRSDDSAARIEALALGADDAVPRSMGADEVLVRARRAQTAARTVHMLSADNDRLRELSLTDGLTQIANRRAFQERLRDEFRRSQRYDDPIALVLLDVDRFMLFNDQHFHDAGDAVLRALADVLKLAVRETDFVARSGGDEFAVLLPNTHLAGALTVAERISHGIHTIQLSAVKHTRITASFGVSCFPARAISTAEQFVKTADDAMYRAKKEGRNKINLHLSTLNAV
jgi:diguanylate cyclase (GGDEF)-like protein